jgi:hypothetical protein
MIMMDVAGYDVSSVRVRRDDCARCSWNVMTVRHEEMIVVLWWRYDDSAIRGDDCDECGGDMNAREDVPVLCEEMIVMNVAGK